MSILRHASTLAGLIAACAVVGCAPQTPSDAPSDAPSETPSEPGAADAGSPAPFTVSESDFTCIRDMASVRGFYVANLLGDLDATLAVASSDAGGTYPPGSVVQLIPTEVMVKHDAGFNPETNDWEFFELDVSPSGATVRVRGFAEVFNQFGGNCLECHARAEPQWDMICEQTHGCLPIPLTPVMFRAIQNTDPRCEAIELPPEQVAALEALAALTGGPPPE